MVRLDAFAHVQSSYGVREHTVMEIMARELLQNKESMVREIYRASHTGREAERTKGDQERRVRM